MLQEDGFNVCIHILSVLSLGLQELAQAFLDTATLESSAGMSPAAATIAAHACHAASNGLTDVAAASGRALAPVAEAAAALPNALHALAAREEVRRGWWRHCRPLIACGTLQCGRGRCC